jgi:flagellar motor switch protein FliG
MLESQLRGTGGIQSSSIGGVKAAANILNFVDGTLQAEMMEQIKTTDADLGQQIEDLMFVFDNLVEVDDRGIQTLLREVSGDNLVLALKGADETLRTKIFRNMSQRAAEMLREDLESRGPVKLSDVESAQKEILAIARRLADEGQIVLGGAGGEAMI